MNLSEPAQLILKTSSKPLAKFGGAHGYRFDGDRVQVNALFTVLDPAAHQRSWALQLWAHKTAPKWPEPVSGIFVAEFLLPPMGEIADEVESFETAGWAMLPAGTGDHLLSLALVSKSSGQPDEVHDLGVYPHREQFCLPRFAGNVGYRIHGGRVTIDVERIENPRDLANLSGTLSLELWALPEIYRGGRFGGVPVAGIQLGSIAGQTGIGGQSHDLPFSAPPAGTWNMVLMLREWTPLGFVTRDFANFSAPLTMDAPLRAAAPAAPAAAAPAAPAPVRTPAPAPVRAAVPAPAPTPAAAPSPAPAIAKTTASIDSKAVSVNSATPEELAAVKGLPKKAAAEIAARRPFRSLDELAKVKGIGPRLLAKIRSRLKL
ncbi:MAG: helix-hairpin-helix domain-containing protein [Verrucomicrobiota bacterium]